MKQRRKEQTNPTNELTANKASFLPHIPLKVNISNEIIGGLTTFLLLSYFFIVSSKILIQALSLKPEVAVTIYSAMVIISALFTVFASIITKLPVVYGISTGLTVFFTASAFEELSINGSLGFGLFIIEGILFLLLMLTPFMKWLINSMPRFIHCSSPAIVGAMILFYALTSVGIIPFQTESLFISATIKTPSIFLFVFVFLLSIVLYFLKVRYSFLVAILIGLFTGFILSKTNIAGSLRLNWMILSGIIIGWLFLFSILYDKKVKRCLDISLWIGILAMFIICIFYNNNLSILIKPEQFTGENGLIAVPSFKAISSLFGNSITSLPSVFADMNKFFIPLLSLLVFHILTYVFTLFTLETFSIPISNKSSAKNLLLSDGLASIVSGVSCVNPMNSLIGTSLNLSFGSKTYLSSIFFSLFCVVGLFLYPLFSTTMSQYIIAPILASTGIILLYKGLQKLETKFVFNVIPFVVVLFLSAILQDITLAFSISLLLYVFLYSNQKRKVATSLWFFCIFLFLFEFFKISIPFLSFP